MNRKWFMRDGVRVKPCSVCKKVLPYNIEYYTSGGTGRLSSYCKSCSRELSKKYNKTNQTRKTNLVFFINDDEYKQCTKCGNNYRNTFEFFDRSSAGQGGLRSDCRNCRLKYSREYSEKHWAWQLFNNARNSSKRNGLEINITEEYVLELYENQKGKCYWLGIKMIPSKQTKSLLQPSIDRLDRNLGYVIGNVVLCCFVANFGRNENSITEWKNFLENLKQEMDYGQWKIS